MSPEPVRVRVRPVTTSDAETWLSLRRALWPDQSDTLRPEVEKFFAGTLNSVLAVLVAEGETGDLLGFVELNIRPYAEGCTTERVGFLEGWYVVPEARRRGVGGTLVAAAEDWARSQGCTEFASDTLADNDLSTRAHRALGFDEVEVLRCFRKDLAQSPEPKA